jgi:hypothetical protein
LIGGRADGNLQMAVTVSAFRQRFEETIKQRGRHRMRTLGQCSLIVSRHHDEKVSRYG